MLTNQDIWQLAEGYVQGTLATHELNALKDKLSADENFANEFNECVNLVRSLNGAAAHTQYKNMLGSIRQSRKTVVTPTRTISLKAYYWRTAAIAAGMALLTSLTTYKVVQNNNDKMASQYSVLRRDLEKYKHSQNQIIKNLKEQQSKPAAEVRYTGTGFALSNDGFLVTNYHVIDGADSFYIQNREGRYFKADVVGFDKESDIAVLKVDDKKFRFGKTEVPYTFADDKRKLGTRIYTLGFPQDEVVYNEGYISAKNGYNGDPAQYQLEIPAYPGQSGAPIMDARGNILAMITGKQTESEGTTYAVSSASVMKLIQSLPKDAGLHMPKANRMSHMTLEQQIDKLEYYTCSIKVYKK
ncbi:MAG: trypsin-like peptidase domain-containing protein [Bacteroidetes bacterium]|nr:trypsin-like peptidase domain-containing protein [Bacteroidota bacterium]